jgi:hypothetical protein
MECLQDGDWQAMAALLLFIVPNLGVLRFEMYKNISFSCRYGGHISINHLLPFLTLKSVSKFYLQGYWDRNSLSRITHQFGTKDLQINHYDNCHKSVIIDLLRCFNFLEGLTYSCTKAKNVSLSNHARFSPQHLGQAIAH